MDLVEYLIYISVIFILFKYLLSPYILYLTHYNLYIYIYSFFKDRKLFPPIFLNGYCFHLEIGLVVILVINGTFLPTSRTISR